MRTWIDLYYRQRYRRFVDLPAEDSDPNETDSEDSNDEEPAIVVSERKPCYQVELAVKIFDMVDELLENNSKITLAKTRKAVSKHQHDMSRFRAWSSAFRAYSDGEGARLRAIFICCEWSLRRQSHTASHGVWIFWISSFDGTVSL